MTVLDVHKAIYWHHMQLYKCMKGNPGTGARCSLVGWHDRTVYVVKATMEIRVSINGAQPRLMERLQWTWYVLQGRALHGYMYL